MDKMTGKEPIKPSQNRFVKYNRQEKERSKKEPLMENRKQRQAYCVCEKTPQNEVL